MILISNKLKKSFLLVILTSANQIAISIHQLMSSLTHFHLITFFPLLYSRRVYLFSDMVLPNIISSNLATVYLTTSPYFS